DRWPVPKESVLGATIGELDKVPAARGYFVDPEPLEIAELPGVTDGTLDEAWVRTLDPSVHLALLAARDALADTRAATDRQRVAGCADAVLGGGLSRPDPFYTRMGFAQLRALAPSGRSYPFDERAAGLVVGEGAGLFVLKRLADAERDGDRIYGVLCGFGLSN